MGPAEPMENLSFPAELPSLRQVSEQLVDEALRRSEGNQTRAARLLGVSQQALSSRLRRHRGRAVEGGGGGQRPPTPFVPLRP